MGSSNYITNLAGDVTQHIEYLPFGELLVDEHLNSYNTPFKFNAKEFDAETGNYYYGARYYDPKFSVWLSVDPLAEKYPGISSYAYVANNPIMFVDPDGKQIDISFIYQKDEKGNDVLDKKGNKILTNINITISGKAINFSDNKIDMDKAVNDISKQLEKSFSGVFDGVTISTKANITVADSMDDVNDDDHLIVFAEAPFRIYGGANDYGGKVAFVDADFFTGWWDVCCGDFGEITTAHEFGHLMGLGHHSPFDNLMRQGGNGSKVTGDQFRTIIENYPNGMNKGTNYDKSTGLPNTGSLGNIFKMKNTDGRNKKSK